MRPPWACPPGKTMVEVFPDNIVDLSLRVRQTRTDLERLQKEVINRVDEWSAWSTKRRSARWAGSGSSSAASGRTGTSRSTCAGPAVFSVTRLTGTNYETQAAAATDLGGIEISRSRLVITIGLATITYNPTATVIIIAAGDAKAPIVVRAAVEEPKAPQYPASVLQELPNARFYLTKGAASRLVERQFEDFREDRHADGRADRRRRGRRVARPRAARSRELTAGDFATETGSPGCCSRRREETARPLAAGVRDRIVAKIERGLKSVSNTMFLHTEPHHDDIMLGYLAHIYHLVRDPSNQHYFANLTSGFTAVSNPLLPRPGREAGALPRHARVRRACSGPGISSRRTSTRRMEDVYLYLDGVAGSSEEMKEEAEARRLLRNLIEVYRTTDMKVLRLRIRELHDYFVTQYPGAKDPPDIQMLKGTIREWEVELLWAYFGIEASAISALRLGFYKGDIFSEEPEVDRDVIPISELIKKVKPNVVSVAFDPEGSGPDTHYKALQAVAEALQHVREGERRRRTSASGDTGTSGTASDRRRRT